MDEDQTADPALTTEGHAHEIAMFLMDEYKASNDEMRLFLTNLAGRIAAKIARDMPTRRKTRQRD
jgi:hypothetical protein